MHLQLCREAVCALVAELNALEPAPHGVSAHASLGLLGGLGQDLQAVLQVRLLVLPGPTLLCDEEGDASHQEEADDRTADNTGNDDDCPGHGESLLMLMLLLA